MASRLVKAPVVAQARRNFAAQAAVATSPAEAVTKPEPLKVSSQKSGLTVASIENNSPVTTLGVAVKAGSRDEDHSTAGICHTLRLAAGLATTNNTSFGICRNLMQIGSSLKCTQGREHTLYTVQVTRDSADIALEFLTDAVSNAAFKPWEVSGVAGRMKLELAQRDQATQAVELLHEAAFRSGLGNSLFCAPHRVGSHGPTALQGFVSKHFTCNRAALLGIGIDHASLSKWGEYLSLESGAGPSSQPSKFHEGEIRVETGGPMAYVALASQCAGAVSVAECLAAMLLQRVLGMGSHIKYTAGQGKLSLAAAAASSGNQAVSSIGQMYSDAGLLGALVVCDAAAAGKVVPAVVAAIRSAKVTDEEVAAAKKNMLADVFTMLESPLNQIENIGSQALLSGDVMPAEKVPELIAGLTTADVQAAAKKLASAKLSLGATGNLSSLPYLDTL